MRSRYRDGAAFVALAFAGVAQAQEPPQSAPAMQTAARVAYDAGYYAQFAPRTALDMIRQTPGFALIEGAERRGFSGAVGNVLIDGERPTAKSQALADILGRIPASQVVRIEVLHGAETAGDASGHSVLANIVRTPSAGQGFWSAGAEYAAQRQASPHLNAGWSGRFGTTDYGLGLSSYSLLRELPGGRTIHNGAGALAAVREDFSPRHFYEAALNGEASRYAVGGRTRLTGQVGYSRYHEDSRILTSTPAGVLVEDEMNPFTESERIVEAGADFDRAFGPWGLSLVGLVTRTGYESDVSSTHRNAGGVVDSVFSQARARDSGESILRASLERAFAGGRRFEASVEGAFNTLDQELALTLDLGGGAFPISVPNSNLSVEETRAEAYLSYAQPLSSRWSLEARLTAETSSLSFTGDAEQSTELSYVKPSLQLTRRIGGHDELRLRLYRDVSQLDFNDFVSAASLADDIIEGGNPDLRPETSWRAEIAGDFRLGPRGALGLTLFRHWLEDAADLVPVGPPGAQFNAPGNIGDGKVLGATMTLRAALAPLVAGGSFSLDATLREAEATDPLTGESRTISDFEETQLTAAFRQDLTAWRFAWGANYAGEAQRVFYRLDEIETRRDSPSLEVFVETRAIGGLNLRLSAVSVLAEPEQRERVFFNPDRNGAIDRIERSERSPGSWLLFIASGSL